MAVATGIELETAVNVKAFKETMIYAIIKSATEVLAEPLVETTSLSYQAYKKRQDKASAVISNPKLYVADISRILLIENGIATGESQNYEVLYALITPLWNKISGVNTLDLGPK